jgi:multidrug efflux pump subunit AcrA (membrane-fusion protein)
MPPIFSQIGVVFSFLVLIAVGVYSYKTEVPVIVEGTGKIISESPLVPIRSASTFTIDRILVSENEAVRKNQILVTSSEGIAPTEIVKVKAFLNQLSLINSRPSGDLCLDCATVLDSLSKQYLLIRTQGELQSIMSPMNDQIRQLGLLIVSYKSVENSLTPIRLQIKNAKQKVAQIKSRQAEGLLARELEELQSSIISGESQIGEKYRVARTEILNLRSVLEARTKELKEKIDQFGKVLTVVAPFDGRVSKLKVKGPGEIVAGGQALMEIMPTASRLMASVDILNRDISQIKVGDEVIVSIDSLPEMDYGTITGKLKQIVRSDIEERAPTTALERSFHILVELPAQKLTKGRQTGDLILGMSLRGRIITRYETLAKSVYRVLFRVKDDLQVTK